MLTHDEFVNLCSKKHNNEYDYSLLKYVHCDDKVTIICPQHGIFEQVASAHKSGRKCPACISDLKKKKTIDAFIGNANKKHGGKFDYSNINYVSAHVKVNIICPVHGVFEQTPDKHLRNNGCPTCSHEQMRLTTDHFIILANTAHNYTYDYSQTNYITARHKVSIICPVHGVFQQTPDSHMRGHGCPQCASASRCGAYNDELFVEHPEIKNKDAFLYVIKIFSDQETFWKVGITTTTVKSRFSELQTYGYQYIVEHVIPLTLYSAYCRERTIINENKQHQYFPNTKFGGWTECFSKQISAGGSDAYTPN